MRPDSPASRTALMVAAYRGRHSARADALFDEPWATALTVEEGPELMRARTSSNHLLVRPRVHHTRAAIILRA